MPIICMLCNIHDACRWRPTLCTYALGLRVCTMYVWRTYVLGLCVCTYVFPMYVLLYGGLIVVLIRMMEKMLRIVMR